MIAGLQFQFRPILTICVGVALAILVSLGNWQLQRLEWKQDLLTKVDARIAAAPIAIDDALKRGGGGDALEYTPVKATGIFLVGAPSRVFGTYSGKPGVFLFEPFEAENLGVIYVNRGFVPQSTDEMESPAPTGAVEISGLLRSTEEITPPASWFRQSGVSADGFWFVRDPEAMGAANGLESVSPFYIDQYAVDSAQWPKGGTTRLDFRNKHIEYALTWFGLAGALIAIWLAMSVSRK